LVPDEPRTYTADEVDAAVTALTEPDRLRHAQEVVTHAAPALQRILDQALDEGGYLSAAGPQVAQLVALEDPEERSVAVRRMIAEEARLGMLVGAAVGFELARELARIPPQDEPKET
jgi:hypothetical protein